MAKTKDRPRNDHKVWSSEDDALLMQLVHRHTPKKKIAEVLERTERAIIDQLHRFHREEWAASGHPESAPAAAQQQANTKTPIPKRIEAKIDKLSKDVERVTGMLSKLLSELHGTASQTDNDERQHVQ